MTDTNVLDLGIDPVSDKDTGLFFLLSLCLIFDGGQSPSYYYCSPYLCFSEVGDIVSTSRVCLLFLLGQDMSRTTRWIMLKLTGMSSLNTGTN